MTGSESGSAITGWFTKSMTVRGRLPSFTWAIDAMFTDKRSAASNRTIESGYDPGLMGQRG